MPLYGYRGKTPKVAPDAFIAPTAVLIGDVTVQSGASVWFGTVLRGDMDRIVIGERSNVQDNSTIHTDEGEPTLVGPDVTIGHNALVHSSVIARNVLIGQAAVLRGDMDRIVIGERSNVQDNSTIHTDEGEPTLVGPDVTIGHNALVHSSVIARNVLIGQAAVLVGGNVIGEETIVGAGAVLPEKFSPPPRSLVLGIPAKVVREARPEDARWTVRAAEHYAELGAWYRENLK